MDKQFFLIFNFITFINLLIFAAILILRKNNSAANILLGLIILDPGLNFLNNVLILSDLIKKVPFCYFLFQGTAMFYGPLVYAYTCIMIGRPFKWLFWPHSFTILNLMFTGWSYFNFLFSSPVEQLDYLNCLSNKGCYPLDMQVVNFLFVFQMLVYFIYSIRLLHKHTFAVKNFFSDVEQLKIKYLTVFLYLLLSLNILLIVVYSFAATFYVEYFYIPLFINFVYLFILYYAFHQNAVFTKLQYCSLVEQTNSLENFKNYQEPLCKEIKELMEQKNLKRYRLTEAEIDFNFKQIQKFMTDKKPYLDPEINLTKFSSALDACSHNISLTINTRYNMNFFDFINYHRVEDAKKMLTKLDELGITIEAVGYDCGFNSKSSFYRAFKKFTGVTPSEFVNSIKSKEFSLN
ncbi:MAG: helix-turn-helix domain-containing protein [Bacteroidales bacterium]|nr:helix-turn-helix domain-containing protein [Bacteroidales bacterium]